MYKTIITINKIIYQKTKKKKFYIQNNNNRNKNLKKNQKKKFFINKQYQLFIKMLKKKIKHRKLRLIFTKRLKEYCKIKAFKNKKNLKTNNFTEKLLQSLAQFIGKKYSIFVTLKHLKIKNFRDSCAKIKDAIFIKKKLDFKLKKFSRNAFFKRTKLILLLVLRKKKFCTSFGKLYSVLY